MPANTLHRALVLLGSTLFILAISGFLGTLLSPDAVYAAPTLRMKLELAPGTPNPIPAGAPFRLRLTYECSSSIGTDECINMQATSTLPAQFDGLQVLGNNDITLASYNAGTKTATWDFRSPLPLGTTGQLEFEVRYVPGTTLDGTTGTITAAISGGGAGSASGSITPPPADASAQPTVSKALVAGGASGDLSVYHINVCAGNTGALNLTNTTITDTLPLGAVYVESSPIGTYDPGAGTLTWGPLTVNVPGCTPFEVVTSYPSGTNPAGTGKTNSVSVTTTPFGGVEQTISAATTHTLANPNPELRLQKTAHGDEGTADTIVGGVVRTELTVDNIGTDPLLQGNVTIDNVQIVDPIPAEQDVFAIDTGAATAVAYQRNGVNTWITGVPLGPSVAVASFPSWVAGDYVSNLRFSFAPLTLQDRSRTVTLLSRIVNPPNGSGASYTVTAASPHMVPNTATASASFGGTPLSDQSSTATIEVAVPKARPDPSKTIISGSPALPEGIVTYRLRMRNGAFAPLAAPVIADLLPAEQIFDPASVTVTKNITGCAATPTFTQVNDYNGSGRTLLLWSWASSGCSIPADDDATIEFSVTVKEGTRAGQYTNRLALVNTSTSPDLTRTSLCAGVIPESSIFTDDPVLGIDTNRLCFSDPSDLTVRGIASIGSAKFVKGQLDSAFSRDPIVGATVQGGLITYQLELENTGNIDLTNLQIVDILPFKDGTNQNQGVRDQDLLGTAWTVQLAGPVTVSPAIPGLKIYYSSELNPCRPTLTVNSNPTCTPMVNGVAPGAGVWSTDLPSDPTAVRSIKFDFGSYTLLPVEILRFTFPAFAPVDAPVATAGADGIAGNSDDTNVAWNTFAYEATRDDDGSTLVAQPPRVGIEVQNPPAGLASYGNYVWHDVHPNGQQDEPAYRGINGVTVKLYSDTDGNPATNGDQTLVGTQITRNNVGGNPGYYLFNALQPGNYFAEFERPDGYTVTTRDVFGNTLDTTDSDIDLTTLRTDITQLTVGENDITWDAGFYANPVSLGNRLWYDTNNDSLDNDGANNVTGISGVTVQLFLDADGNGFLTGNEQNWIAEDTTDADGFYLFTEQTHDNGAALGTAVPLFPAQYLIGIPASQFSAPAPLVGYYSSGITMSAAGTLTELAAPDPDTGSDGLVGGGDDDRDRDDNGDSIRVIVGSPVPNPFAFYDGGVISKPVFVDSNEPTGEPESAGTAPGGGAIVDASSNLTIDFGFYTSSLGNLVWVDDGSGVGGTLGDGIHNGTEPGFAGMAVRLYASGGTEIRVGPDGLLGTADDTTGGVTTNASGSYSFGQLPQGSYRVEIDRPAGYVSTRDTADTSSPNTNTDNEDNGVGSSQTATTISSNDFTLAPGNELTVTIATGSSDDPTIDFGLVRYYSLGNRVWLDLNNNGLQDAGENGIPSVTLRLLKSDGSTPAVRIDGTNATNQTTNANGFYRFDLLPAGDYIVEVLASEFTTGDLVGYRSSTGDTAISGPYEPAPDPDSDIDQDDSGTFAAGVARSGIVSLGEGSGTAEPTSEIGGGPVSSSEAPDNQSNRTVDFGFWPTFSLGNRVWDDSNNNGQIDGVEVGINGVAVRLYRDSNNDSIPDGAAIATATTANGGYYLFTDLIADTYIVEIVTPAGYRSSTGDASDYEPGPDPDTITTDNDDNGTANGVVIRSAPVTLSLSGEPTGEPATPGTSDSARDTNANYTVDFGLFQPLSLGNLVWNDTNNNGLVDGVEAGISGVTVRLYRDSNNDSNPDGAAIATMDTNGTGNYLFTDLGADTYIVEVVNPAGMVSSSGQTLPTPYEPGPDVDSNSTDDDDNGTRGSGVARSAPITLALGGEPTGEPATPGLPDTALFIDANANYTADFGFYTALSLGNQVWYDSNNSRTIDGSEVGIAGVQVELFYDANDNGTIEDNSGSGGVNETLPIAVDTTAADGTYLFSEHTDATGAPLAIPRPLNSGSYMVGIPASQLAPAGVLHGLLSSGTSAGANGTHSEIAPDDPDVGTMPTIDGDDNGALQPAGFYSGGVLALPVTLSPDSEPVGENPDVDPNPAGRPDASDNQTIDFGFYAMSLGNRVWRDDGSGGGGISNDGIRNGGEPGIAGVSVSLIAEDGTSVIATTTTDSNGRYLFSSLAEGVYSVEVDHTSAPIVGLDSSRDPANAKSPDAQDDDDNGVTLTATTVRSQPVTLDAGTMPGGESDQGQSAAPGMGNPAQSDNGLTPDTNSDLHIDFGFVPGDWGDLPDGSAGLPSYNTDRSGTEGPHHLITTGLGIGANIDAETNGQPDATATGDDTNGAPDDEDGVTLPSFYTGTPAAVTVAVRNTTGRDATLYGFIDFNGNGSFVDTNEQASVAVPNGTSGNLTLTFNVPANAVFGTSLGARFRISSDIGLGPDGPAADGEVEDYLISITPTYSLGNRVWYDSDNDGTINPADGVSPGADGVSVRLLDSAGNSVTDATGAIVTNQVTSGGGYYRFDSLLAGDYIVEVVSGNFAATAPLDSMFSSTGAGQEANPNSDGDSNDNGVDTPVAGATRSAVITLGEGNGEAEPTSDNDPASNPEAGETVNNRSNRTLDFGFYKLASLGDLVWDDLNGNGVQDSTESGVSGVIVTLYNAGSNAQVGTPQTTNVSGNYQFSNLTPNRYYLIFSNLPSGYIFSPPGRGGNAAADSNADRVSGQSISFALASGASDQDWDAGIYLPASLGDLVWDDRNANGIQESGESGVSGITVQLIQGGSMISTTVTASDGSYHFNELGSGDYQIQVLRPASRQISPALKGGDPSRDSDIDQSNGKSRLVTLTPGMIDNDLDGGLYQLASVGNRVWEDSNRNGIFDASERGVVGIRVDLYYSAGTLVTTAVTNSDGTFIFSNLEPGDYYIQFSTPQGWTISPPDQGDDDNIDSDAAPISGNTKVFTLGIGTLDLTWWAGLVRSSGLTAITLLSFTQEQVSDGNLLRWKTGIERDSAGFLIYRSATGQRADAEQVSESLILARGVGSSGASYSWLDERINPQVSYSYWLVEIDISGARHEYPLTGPTLSQTTQVYLPLVVR